MKLAQQWGELLYNSSSSSALLGRFVWKSTLEVCIISAGLMLWILFFFNHYGFDLCVSGHGLIPWHSPLKFLDTFLKFIALQVIGRHPCPKVPNKPRFGTLPPRCVTVRTSRPCSSNKAQRFTSSSSKRAPWHCVLIKDKESKTILFPVLYP